MISIFLLTREILPLFAEDSGLMQIPSMSWIVNNFEMFTCYWKMVALNVTQQLMEFFSKLEGRILILELTKSSHITQESHLSTSFPIKTKEKQHSNLQLLQPISTSFTINKKSKQHSNFQLLLHVYKATLQLQQLASNFSWGRHTGDNLEPSNTPTSNYNNPSSHILP